MSDNENEKNALQEVSRAVVITPEDCSGAADFWTHFEVPMPDELKQAFDKFASARGVRVLSLPTGQGLIFKP